MSHFAWQSNKANLFYVTQNSDSEVWFGAGVQRSWAFGINIITCVVLERSWWQKYEEWNKTESGRHLWQSSPNNGEAEVKPGSREWRGKGLGNRIHKTWQTTWHSRWPPPNLLLEGKLSHPQVTAERRGSVLALEQGLVNNWTRVSAWAKNSPSAGWPVTKEEAGCEKLCPVGLVVIH